MASSTALAQEEAAPAEFAELAAPAEAATEVPLSALFDLSMAVSIELGRTTMTVQEILRLGRGSVIELDRLAGEPIDIFVGDRRFAEGEVVVLGEHFGVRITRVVSSPPQPRAPELMAGMGVVAALGLVLALLGLSLRWLQRFAPGTSTRGGQLPMQVVQRLSLGPKQGIAVVRIGERVIAVSIGDGGVRPLAELDEEEFAELPATPPALPLAFPRKDTFRALLRAAKRTAAVVFAIFSLGVAIPAGSAAAQVAQTAEVAEVTPSAGVARADSMITRLAPEIDVRVGSGQDGLRLSGTVGVVVMMGLLTLLPTLILMMTSFTRILIVLHFLRQALGTQSSPPAHLMAGLALLLTGFVMAPTMSQVNEQALQPWMDGTIDQAQMLATGAVPFREFMLTQTRESDLVTFMNMSSTPSVSSVSEVPMVVLISAFVTSELRTAFQIGFALFLPFIVIDLVVASVLMSMGMFMLPPAMIALPFKLLLFVLVDGWSLIVQGLVSSFR